MAVDMISLGLCVQRSASSGFRGIPEPELEQVLFPFFRVKVLS